MGWGMMQQRCRNTMAPRLALLRHFRRRHPQNGANLITLSVFGQFASKGFFAFAAEKLQFLLPQIFSRDCEAVRPSFQHAGFFIYFFFSSGRIFFRRKCPTILRRANFIIQLFLQFRCPTFPAGASFFSLKLTFFTSSGEVFFQTQMPYYSLSG